MSAQMMQNLIEELGKSIGIDELALDEEHRCNLIFDSIPVSFELSKDEKSICTYSYLGDIDESEKRNIHSTLLDANYLMRSTAGSCFGVNKNSGRIALMREDRLHGMQLTELEAIVEKFINYAEAFKGKVLNADTTEGASEESSEKDESSDTPEFALKV